MFVLCLFLVAILGEKIVNIEDNYPHEQKFGVAQEFKSLEGDLCAKRSHSSKPLTPREGADYDFIVVGGGTGGNTMAARLADSNPEIKVLLLESGKNLVDDYKEMSKAMEGIMKVPYCVPGQTAEKCPLLSLPIHFSESPFMVPYMSSTNNSYYYQTTPQLHSNKREINYPRGNLLGGSSATNNLVSFRGHPEDFDNWASLGLEGWGYKDLLPYMKRLETNHQYGDHPAHGTSGPIHLYNASGLFDFDMAEELLKASWSLGYPKVEDFNKGYDFYGAGHWQQYSNEKGRRASTYEYIRRLMVGERVCIDGFIATSDQDQDDHLKAPQNPNEKNEGKRRPCTDKQNLIVLTGSLATKVLLEEGEDGKPRAVGVEYVNHTTHPYLATRKYRNMEKFDSESEKTREGLYYWNSEERHEVMNCPVDKDLAFDNSRSNEWYIPTYNETLSESELTRVYAKREIILSAGAINTPQILMLSGIGPKKHLVQLGMEDDKIVMDLPGIGSLHDHEEVAVSFKMPSGKQHWGPVKDLLGETDKWVKGQKSAFSANHVPAGMDISSEGVNGTKPTIHMHFLMIYFENLDANAWLNQDAAHRIPGGLTDFAFYQGLEHFSVLIERCGDCNDGFLKLRNLDPLVPPFVNPGWGGCAFSLKEIVFGIREARRLNAALPEEYRGTEVLPGLEYQTDDELTNWVRNNLWGHHISGSVPMGPCHDRNAALDNHGRVFGVQGLRVADASNFPTIPHGNIMYTVVTVAEKISDSILQDNHIKKVGKSLLQVELSKERRTAEEEE